MAVDIFFNWQSIGLCAFKVFSSRCLFIMTNAHLPSREVVDTKDSFSKGDAYFSIFSFESTGFFTG